jgi:hypothetical protein
MNWEFERLFTVLESRVGVDPPLEGTERRRTGLCLIGVRACGCLFLRSMTWIRVSRNLKKSKTAGWIRYVSFRVPRNRSVPLVQNGMAGAAAFGLVHRSVGHRHQSLSVELGF